MGTIDESLKASFRELFETTPYKSLSVNMVCAASHVSRASFYKLYSGKDELLAQILRDDVCAPVQRIREAIPTRKFNAQANVIIDEVQCANILEHADFYRKVLKECPLLFERELTRGFADVNRRVLEDYPLDDREKEYMAFFFAANHVMLLGKWIHDGMDATPEELAQWYQKWATASWKNIAVELGVIDRLQ